MKAALAVIMRFKFYFKDYVFYFILAVIGMLLSSGGTAASAYLIKPVIDEIFSSKNEALLYALPIAVIVVFFLKGLGVYLQEFFTALIGQDMVRRFRFLLLSKIIYLDMSFFHSQRSGELISRNTNDIERIRNIVSSIVPEFIREVITALCLLGVVIYQSPKLAFFALVIFPAAAYPLSIFAKKIKKYSKLSQEKISDMTSSLSQIFTNIEIIKANNAMDKELKRFSRHNDKFFHLNIKSVRTAELVNPLMEVFGAIGIASVIIIGGKEVIGGSLTLGEFTSFLAALFMLYTPIKRISHLYNKAQDAVAAAERTFELLDLSPNIVGGNQAFVGTLRSLSFCDVSFAYKDKNVLNHISFRANKDEIIAVIGTSGGGKSTLINLLMRFYDTNEGEIMINENSISEFSLEELRQNIGLVSQRIYIFNDTIAANVAYASGKIDEERVIKALKIANAYEFVSAMSGGIYTELSEFGSNLSGGQRQRIAIARALYNEPKILIFDEATSALDNESERIITDVIERIKEGRIIIVIAHRQSSIKNANKILVLDGGKVAGYGSKEELEKTCLAYQKLQNKE